MLQLQGQGSGSQDNQAPRLLQTAWGAGQACGVSLEVQEESGRRHPDKAQNLGKQLACVCVRVRAHVRASVFHKWAVLEPGRELCRGESQECPKTARADEGLWT